MLLLVSYTITCFTASRPRGAADGVVKCGSLMYIRPKKHPLLGWCSAKNVRCWDEGDTGCMLWVDALGCCWMWRASASAVTSRQDCTAILQLLQRSEFSLWPIVVGSLRSQRWKQPHDIVIFRHSQLCIKKCQIYLREIMCIFIWIISMQRSKLVISWCVRDSCSASGVIAMAGFMADYCTPWVMSRLESCVLQRTCSYYPQMNFFEVVVFPPCQPGLKASHSQHVYPAEVWASNDHSMLSRSEFWGLKVLSSFGLRLREFKRIITGFAPGCY